MIFLWDVMTYYVSLYPLYMSFVWTIGGLLFYFRWERKPHERVKKLPFFSIIVAAHNEEKNIKNVIRNFGNLNYSKYEVIVVNDGSADSTGMILDKMLSEHKNWLKVVHLKPNSGKSKAVNIGILLSKGELILVMDADSFIQRDALKIFAWHFENNPRVGAVTGNPRIINRTSLLGKIQVGEYSSIIGLIKRSQRILGKVLTVSGVMAVYRKSAICDSGLFDSDTVTEDIDMTWKLQKKMWEIRYEPRALCYMFSPETIKGLWNQRVRWAQGGVGVIKKHYDIWFKTKHKRFWPVYIEYIAGIVWSFSLGNLVLYYIFKFFLNFFSGTGFPAIESFFSVPWTGSVLALICLLQFIVSFFIDRHYEKKSLWKYYIWIIWYPVFYWLINAMAIYVGVFNVFIRKGGVSVTWQSLDRGLQSLQ